MGCDKLTDVTAQNTIKTIGKGAFSGCSALTRLVVPFVGESRTATQDKGLLTYWFGQNSVSGTEEIYQYYLDADGFDVAVSAYVPMTLTSISLTDTNRIPFGAFAYMSMLTEIELGNIVSVEGRAFEYANGFTKLELPDALEVIGNSAFAHTALRSIIIPNGVTEIGTDILQGCTELSDITIPFVGKSIKASGNEACLGYLFGNKPFSGMVEVKQNGTSFYIPEKLSNVTVGTGNHISEYAFSNIKSLKTVILPKNLAAIEAYLFYGCSNLNSIVLPDLVLIIGDYAFYGCSKLSTVNMKNVVEIGGYAYQNCSSLNLVSFGSSVKTIGTYAFSGTKLRTVDLPSTIESIGAYAFNGSGDLRTIIVRNSSVALSYTTSMFGGCSTYVKIFVADTVLSSYRSKWSTLGADNIYSLSTIKANGMAIDGNVLIQYFGENESVTIPSIVNRILPYAFYGCQDIKTILIPGSVETIGDYAIYNCTSLESVRILPGVKWISAYTFANCANLCNVSLPSTLLSIGTYAFSECERLTEIALPNKLTNIEDYAFNNCSALTKIEVPNSVASIGYAVFKGCGALEEMRLPYACKTSESNQASGTAYKIDTWYTQSGNEWKTSTSGSYLRFTAKEKITVKFSFRVSPSSSLYSPRMIIYLNESPNYSYISSQESYTGLTLTLTAGNTITFVFSKGSDAPSYYSGYVRFDSIVYATDDTFGSLFGTTSYTGSQAVTQNETTYYIPSGIKKVAITKQDRVPANAFENCNFIEEITLSENTSAIESKAFYNCSSLKEMVLPESVSEVGSYAFYGCLDMANITLSNLTKISDYMFHNCSSLTSITLPTALTEIGSNAFKGCSLLDGIIIPNTVTSIGEYAFSGCKALASVILSTELDSIGSYAFSGCESITEITLPNKLTNIEDYAFNNCSALTKIEVPNSVTSIGIGAFQGCPLESIALPFVGASRMTRSTVSSGSSSSLGGTTLFGYVFGGEHYKYGTYTTEPSGYPSSYGSLIYQGQRYSHTIRNRNLDGYDYYFSMYYIPSTLKSVTITDAAGISANAFYGCTMIESLTLNEGITTIYDKAFYNCAALKSMSLPESVTELGSYAFYGCVDMVSITLSNLTKISDYMFYNCSSLTSIMLPENLIEVGSYAFYNSGLESIQLPNTITSIRSYAFSGCSGITEINLPAGLKTIGDYAFENVQIKTVGVPNGVERIGTGAFKGCSELCMAELPESVISVGDSAFASCPDLRVIRIHNGDVTRLTTLGGNNVFDGSTGKNLIIIAPMDTYQAYKMASYWSVYSSRIYSDEYLVNDNALIVDGTLLQYWGNEKSYIVPENVKTIGRYAFYGSAIEELKYGAGLEQINYNAFANCKMLAKINTSEEGVFNLNGSLKKIDSMAFNNATKATKIIVCNSVETIELGAFKGCNNLTSIELPFIGIDRSSAYSQSQVFGYMFGYESSNKEGTTMQYTKCYYYIPASLREVVITDETVIAKNAFINCSMIESITIKFDLTAIDDYAFYNCGNLKTLTLESHTMPIISAYVFNGDSNVVIKVNSAILSDYQADENWSKRTLEA